MAYQQQQKKVNKPTDLNGWQTNFVECSRANNDPRNQALITKHPTGRGGRVVKDTVAQAYPNR